ncbi:hypothetical protein [Nocardia paucivorans]|uniref:hypothetical protein n=1 Tax=Nocardia paucivorans TaxID=114259 RepID=UPI0002FE18CC|nr:hypothetical protein [Nocardia paucivorans]
MAHAQRIGRYVRTSAIAVAMAAGMFTTAILAAPAASATQSASVVEGRGRILVTVIEDHPQETADETIWMDGRELPHCDWGKRDIVGRARHHRICDVPAGAHHIQVRDPGKGTLFDGRVTVPPPNGLLDIVDTVVSCLRLPIPTDPTYQDVLCKQIG